MPFTHTRRSRTITSRRLAQRTHAFRRAAERYDTWLCSDDVDSIVALITDNKARCVEKLSGTRAIYAVEYEGTRYYIVYDKTTKTIATFLSPEQGKQHELPGLFDTVNEVDKEMK